MEHSLHPAKIIIPVDYVTKSPETSQHLVTLNGRVYRGPVCVYTNKCVVNFAQTIHKLEGCTTERVIIDINKRTFKPAWCFEMFLVAISRIERAQGLHLFPLAGGFKSLDFLTKFERNIYLQIWLSGFDDNGMWSTELASSKTADLKARNNMQFLQKEELRRKAEKKVTQDNTKKQKV